MLGDGGQGAEAFDTLGDYGPRPRRALGGLHIGVYADGDVFLKGTRWRVRTPS